VRHQYEHYLNFWRVVRVAELCVENQAEVLVILNVLVADFDIHVTSLNHDNQVSHAEFDDYN
jgi:hypothetical protein